MFYDQASDTPKLAKNSDFAIFIDRDENRFLQAFETTIRREKMLHIKPGKSKKIKINQIREVLDYCKNQQNSAHYVVITSADQMNINAQNAFLKLLEEPPENYHFAMQVKTASALLPTVLSRGDIYTLCENSPLSQPVNADELVKSYAKQIISAKSSDLVSLVDRITKEKNYKKDSRGFVTAIVNCAIEIAYKSYFKTKNLAFLKKLSKLIILQENLSLNGNIKLHLVADLC